MNLVELESQLWLILHTVLTTAASKWVQVIIQNLAITSFRLACSNGKQTNFPLQDSSHERCSTEIDAETQIDRKLELGRPCGEMGGTCIDYGNELVDLLQSEIQAASDRCIEVVNQMLRTSMAEEYDLTQTDDCDEQNTTCDAIEHDVEKSYDQLEMWNPTHGQPGHALGESPSAQGSSRRSVFWDWKARKLGEGAAGQEVSEFIHADLVVDSQDTVDEASTDGSTICDMAAECMTCIGNHESGVEKVLCPPGDGKSGSVECSTKCSVQMDILGSHQVASVPVVSLHSTALLHKDGQLASKRLEGAPLSKEICHLIRTSIFEKLALELCKATPEPSLSSLHGHASDKFSTIDVQSEPSDLCDESFAAVPSPMPDKTSSLSVAIIVPFRTQPEQDRDFQLRRWQAHFAKFLSGSHVNFIVVIAEQSHDRRKFNRGQLLNAGFEWVRKQYAIDAVIFHDCDLLPPDSVLECYSVQPMRSRPVHILAPELCRSWKYAGHTVRDPNWPPFFGGITALHPQDFLACNGFPNNISGWGAEDDMLYLRLKAAGCMKYGVSSPSHGRTGHFIDLDEVDVYDLWAYEETREWSAKLMDSNWVDHFLEGGDKLDIGEYKQNGLNNLKYKVLSLQSELLGAGTSQGPCSPQVPFRRVRFQLLS